MNKLKKLNVEELHLIFLFGIHMNALHIFGFKEC